MTTTPKAFARNRELADGSEHVRVGLGLHPQLVAERAPEIILFERFLPDAHHVGEVGLDARPRFFRSLDLQKEVFRQILSLCAGIGGKVVSVHSVRAARLVLDMIEEHLPKDRGTVALHWFTGSAAEARRGVGLGCYFSVNEQMLTTPNGRRVLKEVPAGRLLTETDGPFVKMRGQPISPGDVHYAVAAIAGLTNTSLEDTRRQIGLNFDRLLQR